MTILVKKPNCWKRANDGKANPKSGTEICREGGARTAPSCKRRAPDRPHARCTDLRLEGRKDCCVETLAAKSRCFRKRPEPQAGARNVSSSDWVCQECAMDRLV